MTYQSHIASAQAALTAAMQDISGELRTYPTPVSGCDAQYNHLVSERNRVLNALAELDRSPFVATPRTPDIDAGVESR